MDLLPVSVLPIVFGEPGVFLVPQAPKIGTERAGRMGRGTACRAPADEKGDRYPLADIEHVFIWRAVGAALLLERVSVQIKHVDLVERLHQVPTHTPERWAIKVGMVGDHAHYALAGLGDLPLGKPDELHIVIRERHEVSLIAYSLFVSFHLSFDELGLVGRTDGIRGIPEDHQDGHFALDRAGLVGFLGQGGKPRELAFGELLHF